VEPFIRLMFPLATDADDRVEVRLNPAQAAWLKFQIGKMLNELASGAVSVTADVPTGKVVKDPGGSL
jgi:hypothetical protein